MTNVNIKNLKKNVKKATFFDATRLDTSFMRKVIGNVHV